MELKQLIYVSAARRDLSHGDSMRILETARAHNAVNGVTGILLSIDGGFLQILEGSPAAVDETFDRISLDPRHASIRKLHDAPCDRRNFADWHMGFHDLRGDALQASGMFHLTKAALNQNLPPGLGQEVLIFIRTFCNVNAAAE